MFESAKKGLAKTHLACILSLNSTLGYFAMLELIDECQYAINDTLDGDGMYTDPSEVIMDYLGLSDDYLWMFVDEV